MNWEIATEILNLPRNEGNLTKEKIRKAYLKASLKYHPDKYKDNGEKFTEVSEAYVYLCEHNKLYSGDTKNNFDSILEELITKFSQKTNWNTFFIKTTLKGIFLRCDNSSLKSFLKMTEANDKDIFSKLRVLKDSF